METPAQRHLSRELERAQAAEAALRQQHAQMIRQVVRSPPKKKKVTIQIDEEGDRARHAPAAQRPPQRQRGPPAISAFRPPQSPTESQDTVGREIDAAIAKSVAKMLQTPEPLAGPRIVPLPAEAHARAAAAAAPHAAPKPSPTFLTAKRRNMHCELDEPGATVPFPHHRGGGPKRGFLARLFACLGAPPPPGARGVPSSPYAGHTPSRPRPVSAGVSPPALQLRGEMEPLRQSMASLKSGLAAAALADESPTTSGEEGARIGAARRALALPAKGGGAATPPTPRFGPGGWQVVDRTGAPTVGPDQLNAALAEAPSPASSFESLAAELSDAESPDERMYRRTPMAGADGRPMAQTRRRMPSPEPLRPTALAPALAPGPTYAADGPASEALAMQAALLRAFMVPLPPQAQGPPAAAPAPAPAPEVKQTQVSLAQLLGGGAAEEVQSRGRAGPRPQGPPPSRSAAPVEGNTLRAVHQQQAGPVGVPHSAPVSPQKRGRAPATRSAPASRAGSPLRQPTIQPRMTRAAAARNDATQRLLESRRLREQARLAGLSAAQERRRRERAGKRKDGRFPDGGLDAEGVDTPAKRPRSAQRAQRPQEEAPFVGFVLPAAGFFKPVAQPAAASSSPESPPVPLVLEDADVGALPSPGPRSPGFYQMLERLALGMSVDASKVEAEKQPRSPAAAAELRGREGTPEDALAGARPNALYAGQPEPSPLVNVAAQRLVSMNEMVARSGSGESGGGGGDGAAVDASSNTLLGQLLEMQRSLTVDDLALLRAAIRREGGVE